MELHGAPGKPLIPKLTLEDYLNLEHLDVIAPAILRKIIMMHGFNSYKVRKGDLLDAVRSINLMDAHHSTLLSDVSSNAFLDLNDVIRDLSFLRWQECCISSIKTINSVTSFSSGVDESSPKILKQNCNTASGSQEDSEDHETQSKALKKIKENTSVTYYGEQVDQMNRPKARYGEQVEQVNGPKAHFGEQVDQMNRPKARYGEQVEQVNGPKAHFGEQVDPVNRPKAHFGEQLDPVNRPKARCGEQVDQVNMPKAHYEEQVDQVNRPKARYRERAEQVKRPNAHNGEQADPVKKPKRGIKKPVGVKEYM